MQTLLESENFPDGQEATQVETSKKKFESEQEVHSLEEDPVHDPQLKSQSKKKKKKKKRYELVKSLSIKDQNSKS